MELIENQSDFFKKYNILEQEFEYNERLVWSDLKEIYNDYKTYLQKAHLLATASNQASIWANQCDKIHSLRYRVKDPEHLIAKIIREKIKNKNNSQITKLNYRQKVDDIIGIRLLHVFKDDWKDIHEMLLKVTSPVQKPFVFFRNGDDEDFVRDAKDRGIILKHDDDGYRSIHYKLSFADGLNEQIRCEIQVRTLFEEAWSEISHATRYPNNQENQFLQNYFKIYNRLSGALDEMGIFIRDATNIEHFNERTIVEKNNIIDGIELSLSSLIADKTIVDSINSDIEKLRIEFPKNRVKQAQELTTRKDFFEKAITSLRASSGIYYSVIEGPFFLHPDWVINLRNEHYEKRGTPMPNYDVEVKKFVFANLKNEKADVRFIIRNSKRYIAKLEEINIPVEKREQFKQEMIANILMFSDDNAQETVKILCLNTGFIAVSEIYENCALESDKKEEDNPLTRGFYHEATPFVEERKALFDSIFTENFDDNKTQIKELISFINSLWSK